MDIALQAGLIMLVAVPILLIIGVPISIGIGLSSTLAMALILPYENAMVTSAQFGIMIVFNLCIGTITPPVGPILFTGCKVGGVSIEQVFRRLIPFFIVTAVIVLLMTFLPELSLTLPRLLDLVK